MSEPDLVSGGAPSIDAIAQDTLRLLTWNVHKQVDPAWHRDFNRLLDEHQPDIIHLQEARVDSMVAVLECRAESWCWMASPNLSLNGSGGAGSSDGTHIGAFTAARAPLGKGVALLSGNSEPIFGSRKPMMRCELPFRGSEAPLMSLNIHSLNFSLGLKGFGNQLDSLMGAAAAHTGPVIFSGDFNTWSRWRMDMLLRKMESAGLRRVEFGSSGPTRSLFSVKTLDHVFYSPGRMSLKPASARILDSIRSSDHAPLLVDFVPKP